MPTRKSASTSVIAPEEIMDETRHPIHDPAPVQELVKKKKRRAVGLLLWLVLGVLVVSGFGLAFYFYNQYESLARNPNLQTQRDAQELIAKVGKLMELPNETPTIATVTDASKVRTQKFFQHAQTGDKLLAYTNAMEAILYRPSTNKIIAVAPILIDSAQ